MNAGWCWIAALCHSRPVIPGCSLLATCERARSSGSQERSAKDRRRSAPCTTIWPSFTERTGGMSTDDALPLVTDRTDESRLVVLEDGAEAELTYEVDDDRLLL